MESPSLDQCEFIFAQKVRRGQQIFTHYRKLWNDKELMQFLMRIRKQVSNIKMTYLNSLTSPLSHFSGYFTLRAYFWPVFPWLLTGIRSASQTKLSTSSCMPSSTFISCTTERSSATIVVYVG